GKGYYSNQQRGREIKPPAQTSTRSKNWGLLKSYMPVPIDDIAYANKPFDFMRYVEHGKFLESEWTQYHFSQLIHPFSNSISGTMLIQVRALLGLLQKNEGLTQEQAKAYFTLFASTFLLSMGSHSLY
ncbi:MAG TPA: hypothetical protein PLD88_05010, partial [Candidatus Berkiella sp.]|nr:hypothetical protein [Candidatus Berkiella sp.]